MPQNLALHDERMNRSRHELFGMDDLLNLSDYITVPEAPEDSVLRCRVIYSAKINSVEFSQYTPANTRTLKIVNAGNLVYNHKYLDRSHLTALIDKSAADDILVVRNDCITDASYANIVFTDSRFWLTPDAPLLNGTMRETLIRKKIIAEERITINDLQLFTHFRLINAMLGFDAPLLPISNIIRK